MAKDKSGVKETVDFNQIIQAGRKRKQRENLAAEIFSKDRRSSAPARLTARIAKRTAPLTATRAIPTGPSALRNAAKGKAVLAAINGNNNGVVFPRANVSAALGSGISVRGMGAGTYVVIAQNFAPGTTAADIETVLVPEENPESLLGCRIVAASPTVIAELTFASKEVADRVILTYNNKMADGRRLYVYLKEVQHTARPVPTGPASSRPQRLKVRASASGAARQDNADLMEIDGNGSQADGTQRKLAAPQYEDGRFGFRDPLEPQAAQHPSSDVDVNMRSPGQVRGGPRRNRGFGRR